MDAAPSALSSLASLTGRVPRQMRITPAVEVLVLGIALLIAIGSYFIIQSGQETQRLLTPPVVALLLVANLVPGVALLVLGGRRIAQRRAARTPIGGNGQLHVRLVAIFSMLAAVPMILVTIFASLLFQYGVEFWYSDRARGMLENAQSLARESYQQMLSYVDRENVAMAQDLARALNQFNWPIASRDFYSLYAQDVYQRSFSESVVFTVDRAGVIRAQALANPESILNPGISFLPYERELARNIQPELLHRLIAGQRSVVYTTPDKTRSITRIPDTDLFLYSARVTNAEQIGPRMERAQAVLDDYRALQGRSRALQLQFNAALLLVSLLIVGIAVWIALAVADRLVRPVGGLVAAARAVEGGDLSARVPEDGRRNDEFGVLASAFNRMTERLCVQTGALESRRALLEAVLGGISAGVISIDRERTVRVLNRAAAELLAAGEAEARFGKPLVALAPALDALLDTTARESLVEVDVKGEVRTFAVKVARIDAGAILTFDDITQTQIDQRHAAWSDVARRVAHEIKNPLTPIQLAAERLQRRYGKNVDPDDTTFARLTETIVRQVGDLRRMVDEFSSFARMPKPVFRDEALVEIARQALFLHEVAHPGLRFTLHHDEPGPHIVCDRRQLGQALTNIVKNAVEAVEARTDGSADGMVAITVVEELGRVAITVADNGIGLPAERERIVEPYMTTRARGTGLGLAIVKKIVEEHLGQMGFADRPGGGTLVTIILDPRALAQLETGDAGGGEGDAAARRAALTRTAHSI